LAVKQAHKSEIEFFQSTRRQDFATESDSGGGLQGHAVGWRRAAMMNIGATPRGVCMAENLSQA
jgi:hypothetical protein